MRNQNTFYQKLGEIWAIKDLKFNNSLLLFRLCANSDCVTEF